jgi:hypothetical protein
MKIVVIVGIAIFVIALLIHSMSMMFKPKIKVYREGNYECVTLQGVGGASCYRVD